MEKIIQIDGRPYKFRTSAAIPLLYRMKFNRDVFTDMQHIGKQMKIREKIKKETAEDCKRRGVPFDESQLEGELPVETLEMFEKIAFLMNRHADPSQPDNIVEWLDQFETFSIYEAFPEIVALWNRGNMQLSKPKKGNGK